MLPGNRIGTGRRHSIAAGCDLTRITPTALTPAARFIVDCVSRWNRARNLLSAECRWTASALQNDASRYAGIFDWYNWNIKHTELIDLPYGVKENARWKCQPFSRASECAKSRCVSCTSARPRHNGLVHLWTTICSELSLARQVWKIAYSVLPGRILNVKPISKDISIEISYDGAFFVL